jgi:hypothetical protein
MFMAVIDLESIPVDHLGILARNNICFRIVKGFEFGKTHSFAKLGHEILSPSLLTRLRYPRSAYYLFSG